jgi:hypothetical protein
MTPAEARSAALRAIGRLGHHEEECRDVRGVNFIEDLMHDGRYACRTLVRNKSFTTVAVLSLAIGIGANTAVFSVIDPLLFRRLPVPDPDSLVLVSTPPPNTPSYSISYPVFRRVEEQNQVFSGVTAALLLEVIRQRAGSRKSCSSRRGFKMLPDVPGPSWSIRSHARDLKLSVRIDSDGSNHDRNRHLIANDRSGCRRILAGPAGQPRRSFGCLASRMRIRNHKDECRALAVARDLTARGTP